MEEKEKSKISVFLTEAGSYLVSGILHLAFALLLIIMISQGGGSLAGGIEGSPNLPFGYLKNPGTAMTISVAPENVQPAASPMEIIPVKKPVVEVRTSESRVVVPEQPENKPRTVEVKPVEVKKPTTASAQGGKPGEGPYSAAKVPGGGGGSGGKGGDRMTTAVGTGDGNGIGNGHGDGIGDGTGPFPIGVFNELPKVRLDCQKDDENNDSLKFDYEITYRDGDLEVKPGAGADQANPGTIAKAISLIKAQFSSGAIPAESKKTFKGDVSCRCGFNPRCRLIK